MANGLWFRVYCEVIDSHKIQSLPAEDFKWLINLWALAKLNDGVLPDERTIAFRLRSTVEETRRALAALEAAALLDGASPHDWDEHQYETDSPAERMKNYRQRLKKNGTSSAEFERLRPDLLRRFPACAYCGASQNLVVTHVVPVVQGGRTELSNLVMACRSCNARKAGRPPAEAGVMAIAATSELSVTRPDAQPVTSGYGNRAHGVHNRSIPESESESETNDAPACARETTSTSMATATPEATPPYCGVAHSPPASPAVGAAAPPDDIPPLDSAFLEAALKMDFGTLAPLEPRPTPKRADGLTDIEAYFRGLPPPKPLDPEPAAEPPLPKPSPQPAPPPPRKMSPRERERECAENMKRADEETPPLDQGAIRTMCAALPDLTGAEVAAVAGWKLRNTADVHNPSAFLVRAIKSAYETVADIIQECREACRDPVEELRGVDGHGRYRMVYPSL